MSPKAPIRIVLADDHTMVREALARILDEQDEIEVVAQAANGPDALRAVEESEPDVLVLDYSMPAHDPHQSIQWLVERYETLRILVLTVHESVHYALRVLDAGAHGYLIKSAASDELLEAIRAVRSGRVYLSSSLSPEVLERLRSPRLKRSGLEGLSPREFGLLRLIAAGKSLRECAEEMGISVSTASTYRTRITEKLNLRSTAQLIRFALDHDLAG